jgi:hypothetical protein
MTLASRSPLTSLTRTLSRRGVFAKFHNRLASSARRLVIEAAYPL